MSEDFDAYLDSFREESTELLSELENTLLELEENPEDMDRVAAAFRVMHTLKGGAGMFGMTDVASVTHKVETAFDMVRNGGLKVTKGLIDLTLNVCDLIKAILGDPGNIGPEIKVRGKELVETCETIMSGNEGGGGPGAASSTAPVKAPPEKTEEDKGEKKTKLYRIQFTLSEEALKSGTMPSDLIREIGKLGECRVASKWNGIPDIEESDPEFRFSKWDLILSSSEDINDIRGVFIFVENDCAVTIEPAGDGLNLQMLGEIVVDKCFASEKDVKRVVEGQSEEGEKKKLGEILVDEGIISPEERDAALSEQSIVKELSAKIADEEAPDDLEHPEEDDLSIEAIQRELAMKQQNPAAPENAPPKAQPKKEAVSVPADVKGGEPKPGKARPQKKEDVSASSIRVPSARLDALVDLISELVTVQANLSQTSEKRKDPELIEIAEEVERLTAELRDNAMNIRMVAIGTLFAKFKRLVRDLSNQTDKNIEFITAGEDTELDKTVVEKLNDPLLHLIR
ncbi:MAG: Hpt domain-containing protein, partial [Nitrospinota bacterium]